MKKFAYLLLLVSSITHATTFSLHDEKFDASCRYSVNEYGHVVYEGSDSQAPKACWRAEMSEKIAHHLASSNLQPAVESVEINDWLTVNKSDVINKKILGACHLGAHRAISQQEKLARHIELINISSEYEYASGVLINAYKYGDAMRKNWVLAKNGCARMVAAMTR
ncbi:hypothetical protein [Serratia microhaemolytica]|uniref:hypothetical protein n=1 Tax=Serratia microhaemolytica TaxID=2675110 RepID=UPI000FDD30D4|nr:hypothetical protein [Serratia microhaemolytica]